MNLIGLKGIPRQELVELLDDAEHYLDPQDHVITPEDRRQWLSGVTLGMLFVDDSAGARISFEIAAQRLGATVVVARWEDDSYLGESAADTCRALEAMGVDGFVVRHHDRQLPHVLADRLRVPVINAGNGSGENPTQGLADALTLRRHFGRDQDLAGLKVAIVGDVVHSRVARSDAVALTELGVEVLLAGPRMLLPFGDGREDWPGKMTTSRKEAMTWADAIIVLPVQQERMGADLVDPHEYALDWGIDSSIVERYLGEQTVIMHPGPVVRGIEISDPVMDCDRSLIMRQATYGVAVRQALLANLFRN